jgi:hypothetical protein
MSRPQVADDQGLIGSPAEANGNVDPLCHEVDVTWGDAYLEEDGRELLGEAYEQTRVRHPVIGNRDPQRSARHIVEEADRFDGRLGLRNHPARAAVEFLARWRQRQASRLSVHEPHLELSFEGREAPTQAGSLDPERPRRLGNAPGIYDGHKLAKPIQTDVDLCSHDSGSVKIS